MSEHPEIVDAYLVAGGKYHDIDFARIELLKLLAEHDHVRVTVGSDYADLDAITRSSLLITYTCDVRPEEDQQRAIRSWIEGGGRMMALHGTNAALQMGSPDGVEAPRIFPLWADTLGSQFVSHPPIQMYHVNVAAPDHWLVEGIEEFDTDDELYVCEYHDRDDMTVLLDTHWNGEATGFAEWDFTETDPQHLIMYLRPLGAGGVLYNTLGHCRGHYDMRPLVDYYPQIERCSWEKPQYYELLRRGIRWALGADGPA